MSTAALYYCMYVYDTVLVGTEWDKVQTSYPLDSQPKDVNLKLCFVGSYAYSFLVDGLKLGKDKMVRFFILHPSLKNFCFANTTPIETYK